MASSDPCDNCPAVNNASQADADADGAGDACDPCPHVAGVGPGVLTAKLALLDYGGDGPGNANDRLKVIQGAFSSAVAFDPSLTDDIRVTIADAATEAILFGADLTTATGLWRRPNAAKKRWTYRDLDPTTAPGAPGVAAASVVEKSRASGNFVFKMVGKQASIRLHRSGDDRSLGDRTDVCARDTLATCTSVPMRKDLCRNP